MQQKIWIGPTIKNTIFILVHSWSPDDPGSNTKFLQRTFTIRSLVTVTNVNQKESEAIGPRG